MGSVILLGLLVGLDNLQVGGALGLAGMKPRRRWVAAAAFALCETLMPLIGLTLGQGVRQIMGVTAEWLGIGALWVCGVLILVASRREGGNSSQLANRSATLWLLPISLSFDNLVAGIGLGALGYPILTSALVIGALSGGLCAVGLFAGDRAHGWIPEQAGALSGLFFIALAALKGLEVGF